MLLSVTSGSENFPDVGVSKFYTFYTPCREHSGTEAHIGQRAKMRQANLIPSGFPQGHPAAPGFIDHYGRWTMSTYDVANGVMLKIFASMKRHGVSRATTMNQLIRVRAGAALRRINFRTLGWSKGAFAVVHVEGRFDLLTVEEATRLGVVIPESFVGTYRPMQPNGLLTCDVLDAETVSEPVLADRMITNTAGEAVAVPAAYRRRALDL